MQLIWQFPIHLFVLFIDRTLVFYPRADIHAPLPCWLNGRHDHNTQQQHRDACRDKPDLAGRE